MVSPDKRKMSALVFANMAAANDFMNNNPLVDVKRVEVQSFSRVINDRIPVGVPLENEERIVVYYQWLRDELVA